MTLGLSDLDELSIKKLGFAGSNGHYVAATYSASNKLTAFIYDFESGQVKELNDGRIQTLLSYVIPHGTGFALVNKVGGTLFLISPQGAFLERQFWNQYVGWQNDYKLLHLVPKDGQALATLRDKQGYLLLAELDISKQSVAVLYRIKEQDPELGHMWVTAGAHLYLAGVQTGRIDRLNPDTFQKLKTLKTAGDPWAKKKWTRSGKYAWLLSQPVVVGDSIYFRYLRYRDKFGDPLAERQVLTLVISPKGIQEQKTLVLGSWQGKTLNYDWHDSIVTVTAP